MFRALNIVEVVLAIVLIATFPNIPTVGVLVGVAALVLQRGAVWPRLNKRTRAVLAGEHGPVRAGTTPTSRWRA